MKQDFIMLDYPALAALAAVVREGSFERAAAALGITPSAVSQRVRGLEQRLGTVLVARGQPCTATGAGGALCAHLDRVRLLEADLAPGLGAMALGEGGLPALRIAVNSDSLATWFPLAMERFSQSSALPVELTMDDEAHTADRLRSGEVLAAITSEAEPVQGCRTVPLGRLHYRGCASPAFLARHCPDGIDGAALAAAPRLRFDRRDALQADWLRDTFGIAAHGPEHLVPSTYGFLDFTLAGIAWGLQPLSLAAAPLAAGRLVDLAPGRTASVALYWTVTRLSAAALRTLTDAVRSAAAQMLER